jgi:PAS domain S-box-containing protein
LPPQFDEIVELSPRKADSAAVAAGTLLAPSVARGGGQMPRFQPSVAASSAAIVEQLADGVFTVDREFRITSFNRAAEEITGYRREQVVGRVCREVLKASICQHGCALQRAIASGRPVHMRSLYISNARGERMPVSISAGAMLGDRGEVIGAVETFRDVSRVESAPEGKPVHRLPNMVGESPAMQAVYDLTPCVAETDSTVLIEGESGTGKELVARAIHALSPRRDRPLVTVNCGALPDTLLESELFGHRAGAFTDAKRDKPGRFEQAQGGTIFLDEIGDISPALQTRLLRVLQERVVDPVGGTRPVKVDVRVIAATNRSLGELVGAGRFRRDLYYRIHVIKISVPPLRDRREDVPLLIDSFLARLNREGRREIEGVSPEVMEILLGHDFPGNVRELQNVLEHAAALCRNGVVRVEHLPVELRRNRARPTAAPDPVVALQRSLVLSALERHHGNRRATARELGVHPTTLWRRAQKLGIELPEQDGRSSGGPS